MSTPSVCRSFKLVSVHQFKFASTKCYKMYKQCLLLHIKFWNLVASLLQFLSYIPLKMEKLLNLSFPFSNFSLPQPNVLKLVLTTWNLHQYVEVDLYIFTRGSSVAHRHILHLFYFDILLIHHYLLDTNFVDFLGTGGQQIQMFNKLRFSIGLYADFDKTTNQISTKMLVPSSMKINESTGWQVFILTQSKIVCSIQFLDGWREFPLILRFSS